MLPAAPTGTERVLSRLSWRVALLFVVAALSVLRLLTPASASPPLRPVDADSDRIQLPFVARAVIPGIASDGSVPEQEPTASLVASRFIFPVAEWTAVTDRFGAVRQGGVIHGGIDLGLDGRSRSPVLAACSGVVTAAGYDQEYGNAVTINCGDGWSTLVGHLSTLYAVPGQELVQGVVVGLSGSTGISTGEHVHFEIRLFGVSVNPELFLDFGIPPGTPLSSGPIDPSVYGPIDPEQTVTAEPSAPAAELPTASAEAAPTEDPPAGAEEPTPALPSPTGTGTSTTPPSGTPEPTASPEPTATSATSPTPESTATSATSPTLEPTGMPATPAPDETGATPAATATEAAVTPAP